MGVEANTIVMIGVNISSMNYKSMENDEFHELLDKYSDYDGDITYINDDMSGEYLYVGKVLGYNEDSYMNFSVEIDFENNEFLDDMMMVDKHLYHELGLNENSKLIVFNHIY